jgi:hypothetical protein
MKRLIEILESFRMKEHFCNKDDGVYSCPMAENGWYDFAGNRQCNCGFEKNNADVDEAIEIVKTLDLILYAYMGGFTG